MLEFLKNCDSPYIHSKTYKLEVTDEVVGVVFELGRMFFKGDVFAVTVLELKVVVGVGTMLFLSSLSVEVGSIDFVSSSSDVLDKYFKGDTFFNKSYSFGRLLLTLFVDNVLELKELVVSVETMASSSDELDMYSKF